MQVSTRRERHLGTVIGDEDFKTEYCEKLSNKCIQGDDNSIANNHSTATICLRVLRERLSTKANVFPENHSGDRKTSLFAWGMQKTTFIQAINEGNNVNNEERRPLSLPPRLERFENKDLQRSSPYSVQKFKPFYEVITRRHHKNRDERKRENTSTNQEWKAPTKQWTNILQTNISPDGCNRETDATNC